MKPLHWIDARYFATEDGKIVSFMRGKQRVLRLERTRDGYLRVELVGADGAKHFSVARLVLRAFTGVEGIQANHLNGVRDDNSATNLEWTTPSKNVQHAYRVLKRPHPRANAGKFNERHPRSKPVLQLTPDGTLVRTWPALSEANRHGFSAGAISMVCRGARAHHAGYKWRFATT